jgi:hypothetical protein
VALCVPAALLTGCSAAVDLSHSVQTKLGRIDGIAEASVATPSENTGAAIAVTYTSADTSRELSDLLVEIEKVTDEAAYPSYRLDLTPADSNGDRLTVDDTFVDSDDRTTVLDNWFAVTAALLGPVHYTFEPGSETISVDSEAGIAHDIGEASRLHYGYPSTTWTFVNGSTSFAASGRVSPTDVTMFSTVQRSVASDVLPAPASSWRLERWSKQVVLNLDVAFPGAPIAPDRLTVDHYQRDVQPLFDAAVAATREAGLPVRMALRNPTDAAPDVFGYWTSDAKPERGRDPLMRGWDLWLVGVARA